MRTILFAFTLLMCARCEALTVRFLAWDHAIAEKKIQVKSGEKVSEISGLHPDKRSAAVQVVRSEAGISLVFPEETVGDGAPSTAPLAIPPAMDDALVILLPDSSRPGKVRPFVIDDSAAAFRPGTTRFISAGGAASELRMENRIVKLPGAWKPLDVVLDGAVRNVGVQIQAARPAGALLYSAVWEYDPAVRKLAIIIPSMDPEIPAVTVKTFIDRR